MRRYKGVDVGTEPRSGSTFELTEIPNAPTSAKDDRLFLSVEWTK
jgi:hypothetical protein